MIRRGAATAANDVDETAGGKLPQLRRHLFGGVIVAAKGVGQAGVGVDADRHRGDGGDRLNVLA